MYIMNHHVLLIAGFIMNELLASLYFIQVSWGEQIRIVIKNYEHNQ